MKEASTTAKEMKRKASLYKRENKTLLARNRNNDENIAASVVGGSAAAAPSTVFGRMPVDDLIDSLAELRRQQKHQLVR